ncbi:hypothetical protein [Campylobacter helveticus]|uniref:hypothetical protein n=1 Tax=Campylobacter helveticus TaxID=28898 RepID=UPI0022EA636C|nr:hypothetical protein [Campylobacter helveticus]
MKKKTEELLSLFVLDLNGDLIANPLFLEIGQKKILDLNDAYLSNNSVHNYFIAKSIKHLKDNSDLKQEEILYNNFKREQFYNEELLKNSQSKIELYAKEKETLMQMKNTIQEHKSEHFSGKFYKYDKDCNNYEIVNFIVRKNDDSKENKQNQELVKKALEENIKIANGNFGTEYKLFEYRGLTISLEKTENNTLNFYLSTANGNFIEPENLVYKKKDNSFADFSEIVTLGGLMTRINNFCNSINEKITYIENTMTRLSSEVLELEKITGKNATQYPRYNYLLALREDEMAIMTEIEKMSKSKTYKSNFTPKSKAILESMKNKSMQKNFQR